RGDRRGTADPARGTGDEAGAVSQRGDRHRGRPGGWNFLDKCTTSALSYGLNGRGGEGSAGRRRPRGRPMSACRAARCTIARRRSPLAQSAERLHGKEKVYGSIP